MDIAINDPGCFVLRPPCPLSPDPCLLRLKALIKKHADVGLWLEDAPEPDIGINDVLIQVLRTGICGTDVHIYNWDAWAQRTIPVPMVVGHEFVGRIVEVGSNVHDFHLGDIVSGEGHVVCGRCRNCLAGRRHLCKDTKGIGVNRPGAFAQYLALPQTNVWVHESAHEPLDERRRIPRDVEAIFDPFGNAVHTALSFDVLGEDVLITGAGPIGIMAAAVVRHAGARHVVVTDVNPYRLELAKKMGATLAVDVVSELQAGSRRARNPETVVIEAPFQRTIEPLTIPDRRDDIVLASLGFKFTTGAGLTAVANGAWPLNRGGLRPGVMGTLGLEYTF